MMQLFPFLKKLVNFTINWTELLKLSNFTSKGDTVNKNTPINGLNGPKLVDNLDMQECGWATTEFSITGT